VAAQEFPFARQSCDAEPKEADLVFVGDGCGGLPNLTGRIAALDAGRCTEYEKAMSAQRAGAAGFLIARTTSMNPASGSERVTIPGASIAAGEFNQLRSTGGTVRVRLSPPPDNTWGYIRIFDIADLTAPQQIGSFATENARRCPAQDNGWYSVHNPVVVGNTAYLSWYSDGVRAVDISDPRKPVEIGSFVIGGEAHERKRYSSGHRDHVEQGSEPDSFVWGVVVQDGLIYLSDEMTGLWIVRLSDSAKMDPQASDVLPHSGRHTLSGTSRR
jgi:hypothetical protein